MTQWPKHQGVTVSPRVAALTVGRFVSNGAKQFLPVSGLEMFRSTAAIKRVMASFHFRGGQSVLVISVYDEVVQFQPAERAAMEYGLVVCSADSTRSDASRTESCIRRFDIAAAFGVNGAVIDGLLDGGHDLSTVFGDSIVWARPDAFDRLDIPGRRRMAELGPATVFECQAGDGAHIDRFEWAVAEEHGEIVLSSRAPRVFEFNHYLTGVAGSVERGICTCGNPDPRIRFS